MKARNNLMFMLLIAIMTTYALGVVGCSGDSNPVGDDSDNQPPAPVIKQPKSLQITKIGVSAYGQKNGGDWDFDLLDAAKRRPDIYVQIRTGNNSATPIYISTVEGDAFSGVPYDFTQGKSGNGYHLPRTVSANGMFWINMMDDDIILADDEIGTMSMRPSDYYDDDNATGFYDVVFGTNGTKFSVHGTWIY